MAQMVADWMLQINALRHHFQFPIAAKAIPAKQGSSIGRKMTMHSRVICNHGSVNLHHSIDHSGIVETCRIAQAQQGKTPKRKKAPLKQKVTTPIVHAVKIMPIGQRVLIHMSGKNIATAAQTQRMPSAAPNRFKNSIPRSSIFSILRMRINWGSFYQSTSRKIKESRAQNDLCVGKRWKQR